MKFGNIIPTLRIFDEAKAREFYIDFLGFEVVFEHRFEENTPIYMEIHRDDCFMHLSEHHGDCSPGAAIRIEVDDVWAYQKQLLEKHYKYSRPAVEEMEWGTADMTIGDPFGNRLTFASPLKSNEG